MLMLGGCVLPAGVPEPDEKMPASYRAQNKQPKESDYDWPAPDWWRNFRAPELTRLIEQAQRANYDIAAASARVAQADAQIEVSGASLLPSVQGNGSFTRNYRGGTSSSKSITIPDGEGGVTHLGGSEGGSTSYNSYQLGANASYEIDFWGKNRSALASAKQAAIASRFDKDTVALTVESSVATTYFNILVLQQRLRIAEQNLEIARNLVKPLQAALEVGTGDALDLTQQQTEVANQQAAIPPLRQELQQNINALAVLLGKAPADLKLELDDADKVHVPDIDAGLPSSLLTRRPDVAQARAELIGARADVSAARAEFLPTINLTARAGWEQGKISGLFNAANQLYTLAANLTQPIFEGGRLKGQLKVSKSRYQELLANYHASILTALEDVDDALTELGETTEREQRLQEAVDKAQQALDISDAQLKQGIIDVTTLLNIERNLFSARDSLAQARQQRLTAAVNLYQALGGGWDEQTARQSQSFQDMPKL